MSENGSPAESKCPFLSAPRHTAAGAVSNADWWPEQINLGILHQQSEKSNPMDASFDYAAAFESLDLDEVKADITAVMTDSKDWWPADYGHYGPLFIRMAWHAAGTYRVGDGRGGAGSGMLRLAPLNSWPDNANLDKARRLLWPVKKKYGAKLSWADLMVLTGNCAIESMGLKTFGFGGGRVDKYEPEEDINWGPESEWLGDERYSGDRELADPLGAVQMGLIYVNPEGPNGNPDPIAAARDIRETFKRMAMNDEETVALIAGGHTFGKCHGGVEAEGNVGREPEGAGIAEQALGWANSFGSGNAEVTYTSGLEGAWTAEPTKWDNGYFDNLFGYDWVLTKSPAGAQQWVPAGEAAQDAVPDAHDATKRHAPIMLTTDLALKEDPAYGPISKRFHEDPDAFADAFARGWYKLTHRDMGPIARYRGSEVPDEVLIWQDAVPAVDHDLIDEQDIAKLKESLLGSGLSIADLVSTAWASAATFRGTDMRGGANGARIRLAPQKYWAVNDPEQLPRALQAIEQVQAEFNAAQSGKRVSLADLIVLGGCAAIESAAKKAGHEVTVPFSPGRTDATAEMTDVESFAVLEPTHDGFRNYHHPDHKQPGQELLLERAFMLNLTAPQMTVLVGGMRALNANTGRSRLGVLTDRPEELTNDFFVNLLDMSTVWAPSEKCEHFFEGKDRGTGAVRWTATAADLVFGSNSQLRTLAEVYGADDGEAKFVQDFVTAWDKVMNLDRFE